MDDPVPKMCDPFDSHECIIGGARLIYNMGTDLFDILSGGSSRLWATMASLRVSLEALRRDR